MSLAPPIGILGGTFDPIHYAHLRLGEELAERVGLAQVRFVPARVPPHRATPNVTAEHRLEMTRLATAGNPRFSAGNHEVGHGDFAQRNLDKIKAPEEKKAKVRAEG